MKHDWLAFAQDVQAMQDGSADVGSTGPFGCHTLHDINTKGLCCKKGMDAWLGKSPLHTALENAEQKLLLSPKPTKELVDARDQARKSLHGSATWEVYEQSIRTCTYMPSKFVPPLSDDETILRQQAESEVKTSQQSVSQEEQVVADAAHAFKDAENAVKAASEISPQEQAANTAASVAEAADLSLTQTIANEKRATQVAEEAATTAFQAMRKESRAKNVTEQAKSHFDLAYEDIKTEKQLNERKLEKLRDAVKVSKNVSETATVLLKQSLEAYEESTDEEEKPTLLGQLTLAQKEKQSAQDKLEDAHDAFDSFQDAMQTHEAETKARMDQMADEKNFANTEYQKAVDSAKDAQTSLHAAEASAAEATHQMQDQKSKTDTAKVALQNATQSVKGVYENRNKLKDKMEETQTVVKQANSLLSNAKRKTQNANEHLQNAIVKEESGFTKAAAATHDKQIVQFEQTWSMLQNTLKVNDEEYRKLLRCTKNNQWAC
jgi:hypothetical protein